MFEHDIPFTLNSRVRRLVAPNPGMMTGPGTNTYLLGQEQVAVLDPGPAIPAHVDAILAAAEGKIRWIVCTHTHPDHSPAWQAVAAATGAEVIGALPADDRFQDDTFQPTLELSHDWVLRAPEFTLRALHTPGHVNNHYCFLLEEDGMLFAGDHIMNGSTVVIVPPGGDMKAYIESLRLLLDYPLQSIAPGHGDLIHTPREEVTGLVEHRLARERKVAAGLSTLGQADMDALVKVVYDDVDPARHEWAKLSLAAHLIKLAAEGRARQEEAGAHWVWLG
ncbi:MBL fold metallo-hydrolase [Haliea sp. E1-2-M8]|uniref:MBL fold metallo-hydrolase n=1 Tax=Haliea sp. E1-2-M8 TaxID=3064706 RepID=UPI002717725D|nr:MBL fold metallo-hydrolase [Haliea sp. E1-2-M8]MDO8862556.1 MBL fold metallo-hydrolase [Haliea sp. E1-2-M8]